MFLVTGSSIGTLIFYLLTLSMMTTFGICLIGGHLCFIKTSCCLLYHTTVKNVLYVIADEKYLAFVTSQKAHAKILGVDSSEAVKLPGVVDFISYKDIPGHNLWGGPVTDEEILASEKVSVQHKLGLGFTVLHGREVHVYHVN
jgi:hypothetical protein